MSVSGRRDRLVIFGDRSVGVSGRLLRAFLAALRTRQDIELVAVCDTVRTSEPSLPWRYALGQLRSVAVAVFNPERRHRSRYDFEMVARRHGIRVVVPPEFDVNHPRFIAALRDRYRPTLALCLCSLQIFSRELLASFDRSVNFHDGYLPFYKGLNATAWSLYHRESHSGYAWHMMDADIDTGPVIHRDRVEVGPGEAVWEVRNRKLASAAGDAGHILDLMVQRAPGEPQTDPGTYFSRRDRKRICRLESPETLPAGEILHRLRSFEILEIQIGGNLYEVTALREIRRSSALSLTTSDGRMFAPRRCMFLPVPLYRIYRNLKGPP